MPTLRLSLPHLFRGRPGADGVRVTWASAAALAAVCLLPAAIGAGPTGHLALRPAPGLLPIGEDRPVSYAFTVTCASPPPTETHVDVQVPSGNHFALAFAQVNWTFSPADCAAGPVTGAANGTFRFTADLPAFAQQSFRMAAWVGDGQDVVASADAWLNETPDAHLAVGAILSPPLAAPDRWDANATHDASGTSATAQWTVTNYGTGAFTADATVEAPDWVTATVPATLTSGASGFTGASATLPMTVHLPATCPRTAAVLTLHLDVHAADPRSPQRQQVNVQGYVPCLGRPAGAPALGVPLVAMVLAALAAAVARRT